VPESCSRTGSIHSECNVPTPEERNLIDSFHQQRKKETPAPKMKVEEIKG
jgi:hypothetical protein